MNLFVCPREERSDVAIHQSTFRGSPQSASLLRDDKHGARLGILTPVSASGVMVNLEFDCAHRRWRLPHPADRHALVFLGLAMTNQRVKYRAKRSVSRLNRGVNPLLQFRNSFRIRALPFPIAAPLPPRIRGSITPAAASADSAPTRRRFAREIDMFGHRRGQRITVWTHRIPGERRTLPRFDPDHVGAGAAREQRSGDQRKHKSNGSHFHDG